MAVTLVKSASRGRLRIWNLPGTDPHTPNNARVLTRALLADLDPELVYDIATVVSELVTNAIRYSLSGQPDGVVSLRVLADREAVSVSVLDQGGIGVPVIGPEGRMEGGLGLLVCADLGEMTIKHLPYGCRVKVRFPLEGAA